MSAAISLLAGKPAPASLLVDVTKLLAAYADQRPDPKVPAQRVAFGTSGHRGSPPRDRLYGATHTATRRRGRTARSRSNSVAAVN